MVHGLGFRLGFCFRVYSSEFESRFHFEHFESEMHNEDLASVSAHEGTTTILEIRVNFILGFRVLARMGSWLEGKHVMDHTTVGNLESRI